MQANVICIVYSVEDFTSVEKVSFMLYVDGKLYYTEHTLHHIGRVGVRTDSILCITLTNSNI